MSNGWLEHFSSADTYRPDEERVNTMTHGLGCVLAILGAALIIWRRELDGLAVACFVYAASLVMLYAASACSHAFQEPELKHRLRSFDQGAIYFLIAGTYTPFIWSGLPPGGRWLLMAAVWSAAVLGFHAKVVRQHRVNAVATRTYVLLGWLPAIALIGTVSGECLAWMLIGGVCYTVGIIFLKLDHRVRFFHAVWHLFVMAGSATHYYAIYRFVLGAEGASAISR